MLIRGQWLCRVYFVIFSLVRSLRSTHSLEIILCWYSFCFRVVFFFLPSYNMLPLGRVFFQFLFLFITKSLRGNSDSRSAVLSDYVSLCCVFYAAQRTKFCILNMNFVYNWITRECRIRSRVCADGTHKIDGKVWSRKSLTISYRTIKKDVTCGGGINSPLHSHT